MLFISRVMSCLSPTILPPRLFISSKVLQTLVSSKSPSLHKPSFLPQSPLMSSFKSPLSLSSAGGRSDWALTSQRASGEIHVIVGPMFAGKTTALLRRITSEGKNGRFMRNFFCFLFVFFSLGDHFELTIIPPYFWSFVNLKLERAMIPQKPLNAAVNFPL